MSRVMKPLSRVVNRVTNARALVIVVTALALRGLAIWQLGDLPISRTPQLDALEYMRWAEQIAARGFVWPEYPEHAPGYPFFLGAILWLTGGSLTAVRVVQAVMASLACLLTARIAGRTLTPRACLAAGLVHAAYAPFIYLDTAILAEPLLIFLMLLATDIATRAATRESAGGRADATRSWILAGLALGAAAIVRPTALVLLPAFAMALRAHARPGRVVTRALSLATGVLMVAGPVVIQNCRVTGVPLIQAYGGMNVYLGNTVSGDGGARARPGGTWDLLEAEASRAGTSRNEQDRYFVRRTLTEIAGAPLAYLTVLANKGAWLTQQEELRDTHSLYFFREHLPLLRWLPGFGLAFALAAVGLMSRGSARARGWLLWPLLLLAATVIFLVVGLRYRAPLVPFVIAWAGGGLAYLIDTSRTGGWRPLARSAAILVAVFVLANLRTDTTSRNLAEEWALTALSLEQEGDHGAAERAYRQALVLEERSGLAWTGLGVVLESLGREDEARTAFEQAVSANDTYALAWHHAAAARDRAGDLTGALLAYRRALEIAPERTDTILAFGLTLHRVGRLQEAESLLQKAAARGEGRAHFALALSAMKFQDLEQARHHAREAARLGYAPARELVIALDR
jgi:tetratricopeptide (TPR) repeat protein